MRVSSSKYQRRSCSTTSQRRAARQHFRRRRLFLESLEERRLLALDFGDAPAPYPVTLAEDGARHEIEPNVGWLQLGGEIDRKTDPRDRGGIPVSLSSDGTTVAIGGDFRGNDVFHGCPCYVQIYRYHEVDDQWNQLGEEIDAGGVETFGYSVSLSSDGYTVAIGAPNINGPSAPEEIRDSGPGYARIFRYNETADNWVQLGEDIAGKLTGLSIGESSFGSSVSLSSDGNTVAIGAPRTPVHINDGESDGGCGMDDYMCNFAGSGYTRIYHYSGAVGGWVQIGEDIKGEHDPDSIWPGVGLYFDVGQVISLSADGNTLAMGDTHVTTDVVIEGGEDEWDDWDYVNFPRVNTYGQTRIYRYDQAVGRWDQIGPALDGESRDDHSGWSVSLNADGNTVAVGAPFNDGALSDYHEQNDGHARIYRYFETVGRWVQLGGDIDGEAAWDESGRSVSLSADGNTVAIGAPFNDGNGDQSGHTRIFHFDQGVGDWIQLGEDIDGESFDFAGSSVALNAGGNTAAARGNFTRIHRWNENGLTLGSGKDHETNGTHSTGADADGADEDGIVFGTLSVGQPATVDVYLHGADSKLDAWVDFDGDGDWDDAGDRIFASQDVVPGGNMLSFPIPATAAIGNTYARFRLSTDGGLTPRGLAADGEVEDYTVEVVEWNDRPTLDPIADLTIEENGGQQTVALTGVTAGDGESQPLHVIASSRFALCWRACPDLIDDLEITYTSPEQTGSLAFTPGADRSGTEMITVKVEDGGLDDDLTTQGDNATFSHTFSVTIRPKNTPPVAVDDAYTVAENNAISSEHPGVLDNDNDLDGDTLTAVLNDDVSHGTLTLATDGGFSYVPNENFNRTDTFTYRANDGRDLGNIVSVPISVETQFPWYNGILALDVNDDGSIAPNDAILSTSGLNRDGSGELSADREDGVVAPFYDTNRDGHHSPIDVLLVVSYLNSHTNGEGEAASTGSDLHWSRETLIPPRILERPAPTAADAFADEVVWDTVRPTTSGRSSLFEAAQLNSPLASWGDFVDALDALLAEDGELLAGALAVN